MLWTSDAFSDVVAQNLALRNGSQALEWWRRPPLKLKVELFLFNYSNADDFLSNGTKLRVQEIGPYTYLETQEKVNLRWPGNGTISFQEKRSYEFVPELSAGGEDDAVVAPNVPLFAAVARVRDEHYLVRLSLASLLRTLGAAPFVRLSVRELLWGYDDPLFALGRAVWALKANLHFKRFGLLAAKSGTSPWRLEVRTGEREAGRWAEVARVDGRESAPWWSGECARLDGTDGTRFPPADVRRRRRIHIYSRDICRRFPLDFTQHSKVSGGIPALRFQPPRDVFASPKDNADNACYCSAANADACPPAGLFNISPCAYDTPMLVSFPHFFLGDAALRADVEGLQPDPARHDSFVDVHPELGVPLAGSTSLQLNMMVRRASGVPALGAFRDGLVLPLAWIRAVVDELPPELHSVLMQATFGARAAHLVLLYGLPAVAVASAFALLRRLRRLPAPAPAAQLPPPAPAPC